MLNYQVEDVPEKTKELIDKLLLGRLSLSEIAKVTGLSEDWIQYYLNSKNNLVYNKTIF